jgi:hypothetical protein
VQAAAGGAFARYEQDFVTYAEKHWAASGADYNSANYYDRAMIYYVWWARTGNATYLDRANQLAINSRAYIESANFRPQPYLLMLDGVALHALVTGDQRSATAVAKVADAYVAGDYPWMQPIGDTTNESVDSRTQARVLSAVLNAWYLRVPSPAGVDYAARLRRALTNILGTQSADGAYRWAGTCGYNKPFMTGMLDDALIRYYTMFEADARIPGAVKRAVDYMWANNWVSSSQGFEYLDNTCGTEGNGPAADLNGLIVSGFGFVAKVTGDASYLTKGDAVFSGGVYGSWLDGGKQFNQQYTASYRYLGLRF